jgi:GAF domain-containing protein
MAEDRNTMVAATFVTLADTLVGDYDIAEFLHSLVARCAALLTADTAGVLLETADGKLRLAAALSDEMRVIEELEMTLGQGPCLEAYRAGEQVIVEDLETSQERWPEITPKLLALGMRAACAFPLRLRGDRIGALNLYRAAPGRFHDDDISLGQAFADVAAIGILQERKFAAAQERAEQLQHALDSRVLIEQAKGVIAERHGVTPQEAFERLRSYARSRNLKLHEVGRQVTEGGDIELPPMSATPG